MADFEGEPTEREFLEGLRYEDKFPEGPTVYAKLMDVVCDQPRRQLRDHFSKRATEDADAVSGLLYKAYQEGLRDGYAQGVAAATDKDGRDA